jgi:hypothetical protein
MVQPINAAPYTNYQGFDDESKRTQAVVAQATPTHLPLCPLYTPWGTTDATVVDTGALSSIFGVDTFNTRSAFFNHQSLYAQMILSQGNQIMVQRLIPSDAGPKARILLSLDIVADSIQQYTRNSDGSYALDVNGAKIPVTGAGAKIPGFVGKWVLNNWLTGQNAETFGECQVRAGSLVSSVGSTQSQLYPIVEFEATFQGALGNNLGLRLIAPTTGDASPLNSAEAGRVMSYIYRMQMVQRATALSSATVIPSQSGEQWADFSFLPGAYDPNTDQDLDFQTVLATAFSQHGIPSNPPIYGSFETSKVYQSNLATVLGMIGAAEAPLGLLPDATLTADSPDLYTVNPFSAVNYDGIPYYTLQLEGAASGGLIFTPNSTFYAVGASDGTMTQASFDADVATFFNSVATSPLLDLAKYPFSILYDSGYTLQTKYLMAPLLGLRPDIAVIASTQSALDPLNTPDQDSSIAVALAAMFGNYPDSTVYGTACCRAMIVGSAGTLLNSGYTAKNVPLSLQLAKTFAAYMGAGNGIWDSTVPPDENPQNIVNLFRDVNAAYKPALARSKDWATGLVWIENFDTNTQYFPALASVYPNDTSILKGFMNILIACDLVKIAHSVRRYLSGISRLTDAQFVQRSNQLINAAVKGRYAGRVSITPNTFYSTQDVANGYSWSCEITMYGNNMRTVASDTIIARRLSDLATTATS